MTVLSSKMGCKIFLQLALRLLRYCKLKQSAFYELVNIFAHNICYRHLPLEKLLQFITAARGLAIIEYQPLIIIKITPTARFGITVIKRYSEDASFALEFRRSKMIVLQGILWQPLSEVCGSFQE